MCVQILIRRRGGAMDSIANSAVRILSRPDQRLRPKPDCKRNSGQGESENPAILATDCWWRGICL